MTTTNDAPRRVALVTGCASRGGIGAAIARRLARSGRAVMVTDLVPGGVRGISDEEAEMLRKLEGDAAVDWKGLESLVEELRSLGVDADWTVGDVTDEADASRMVAETVERLGGLDILVNNASAPQYFADIAALDADRWEGVQSVNIRAPFLMAKHAVPQMRPGGWGRVINIVSTMSEDGGHATQSAHTASKAALAGFTKAIAQDVGPDGITVNGVSPTATLTDRGKAWAVSRFGDDPDVGATAVPMRRFGRPEDIAGMVNYLASEEAGYVSAQVIRVDGGARI